MKQYGLYTKDAAKAFKGAVRVLCWIDGNDVFVTNSYVVYRMPEFIYNELLLPVLKMPAGDWSMMNGEKIDGTGTLKSIRKIWKDAVEKADAMRERGVKPLERAPMVYTAADRKTNVALYYSASGDFAIAFDSAFFAFNGQPETYSESPISPAVQYASIDGKVEPIAMVVPMRISADIARSVRAYFVSDGTNGKDAEKIAEEYDRKSFEQRSRIVELENKVRRLEAQLAEKADAPVETEAHDAPVVDLNAKTEAALAIVEKLGCKATLKGAKTARPVVWIEDGEKQADALKAAGAMFSRKRNAYYISVA